MGICGRGVRKNATWTKLVTICGMSRNRAHTIPRRRLSQVALKAMIVIPIGSSTRGILNV